MDKNSARKKALKERLKLDNIKSSKIVIDNIVKSNVLNDYNNIGIYFPIGKEINIMELVKIYPNKNFYLPITKDEISFVKYDINTKLIKGPFNTFEPEGNIINRDLIDCFLIPCVAISNDNKRIGYGKGYYDRYLNNYNKLKIGICYKELVNLDIDMENHDLKLDLIFTDNM